MSEYSKTSLFYHPTAAELEEMLALWDARTAQRKEIEDKAYDAYVKAVEQRNRQWEERQAREAEQQARWEEHEARRAKQIALEQERWRHELEAARIKSEAAREERIKARIGLTKERRSRTDWGNLIDDPSIVERQERWERNHTTIAMRKAGLTFREIGERMGVTTERARQMWNKAIRNEVSPVERFLVEWNPISIKADHGLPARRRLHKTLSVFAANLFWINGELDGRI